MIQKYLQSPLQRIHGIAMLMHSQCSEVRSECKGQCGAPTDDSSRKFCDKEIGVNDLFGCDY
eukprot:116489-Amphidinium_carterae.1